MTYRLYEASERRQSSQSCRPAQSRRASGTKPPYAPVALRLIGTVSRVAERLSRSRPSSPSRGRVTKALPGRQDVFRARSGDWLRLPASGLSAIAQQPFRAGNRGSPEPIELLSESIPVLRTICPEDPVWIPVEHGKWRQKEPHSLPLGVPFPHPPGSLAVQAKSHWRLGPERVHSAR